MESNLFLLLFCLLFGICFAGLDFMFYGVRYYLVVIMIMMSFVFDLYGECCVVVIQCVFE